MSHEKIDTDQVVNYLSHSFEKTQQQVAPRLGSKAHRHKKSTGKVPNGTTLYRYQVEFCYLIDEIQRGPQYIVPKIISDANELIAQLENEEGDATQEQQDE